MKNPDAVALGKLGGRVGGPARAAALSPERRSEIAREAAFARHRRPYKRGGIQQITRIPPYWPGTWATWDLKPYRVEELHCRFDTPEQDVGVWFVRLAGTNRNVPVTELSPCDPSALPNVPAYQEQHPGTHLRRARKERGWSLEEVARRVGCSACWLNQLELSGKPPSLDLARKLANVLGIPFGALRGGPQDRADLAEMIRRFDIGETNPPDQQIAILALYFCWPARELLEPLTGIAPETLDRYVERLKAAEFLTETGVEAGWLEKSGNLVFVLESYLADGTVTRERAPDGEWLYRSHIYRPGPALKRKSQRKTTMAQRMQAIGGFRARGLE